MRCEKGRGLSLKRQNDPDFLVRLPPLPPSFRGWLASTCQTSFCLSSPSFSPASLCLSVLPAGGDSGPGVKALTRTFSPKFGQVT